MAPLDIRGGRFVPHRMAVPGDVEALTGNLLCDVHLVAENPLPLVVHEHVFWSLFETIWVGKHQWKAVVHTGLIKRP